MEGVHPLNYGGGVSKAICFALFFGPHPLIKGGTCTSVIKGVWVAKDMFSVVRVPSQAGTFAPILLVAQCSAILRYCSCCTPHIARYPSEGSLTCDTPPYFVLHASKTSIGSGQEACLGPSRPVPGRNAQDQHGTRTGRDGPHLGTWMGLKRCETKHMANLDGTPLDLDGPGITPRRGSG